LSGNEYIPTLFAESLQNEPSKLILVLLQISLGFIELGFISWV
jgi:hypothetical protein